MALKKTTTYLSPDAQRVIRMHGAEFPKLSSGSEVINDIIERYALAKEAAQASTIYSMNNVYDLLQEQQSSVHQLIQVSLRNFGLNIEIARVTDPALPVKGEQRAKLLLKQMQGRD